MEASTATQIQDLPPKAHNLERGEERAVANWLSPAMLVPVAVALVVGVLGWTYQALKPPPPKICGSPNGPPITSPRVKLSDGRHLAYREVGVSKEVSNYRFIVVHGFDDSKDINLPVSRELIEEKGLYFLLFDRAGYGESDPNPSRTVKSEAFDIQQLADLLQIGSKFYLIGISMGAYPVWACLHYIPHRLRGVSLVVPFVHYWWPNFPSNLSTIAFNKLKLSDQWAFRVAHYAPWLLDWWITQKWFPSLSMMEGSMDLFSPKDLEVLKKLMETPNVGQEKVRQQGTHESLIRDLKASFGKWEFGPLDVKNPFPEGGGSVHLWQGYEDRIIPFEISRYITEKLPWIQYHEIPNRGHLLMFETCFCEAVVMALLQ